MRSELGFKRIATEEAFATPEIINAYRDLLARKGSQDIGFNSLMGYYLNNTSDRARAVSERLQDLAARRIADMDATGIDVQILSITSPGVQIFDADTAVGLARAANDELAAAIAAHPDRYAGLAAIAPQNPAAAAAELERGVRKLGFKGAIINSHTHGEYLDDPKYWDILAAAEALEVPIYIHPNTPCNAMIETLEGVANAEEIAATHGVDVVILGNNDLSSFSGWSQNDPRYQDAIIKVHNAALKYGKYYGNAGAQYLNGYTVTADTRFVQNGPARDGWTPPRGGGGARGAAPAGGRGRGAAPESDEEPVIGLPGGPQRGTAPATPRGQGNP